MQIWSRDPRSLEALKRFERLLHWFERAQFFGVMNFHFLESRAEESPSRTCVVCTPRQILIAKSQFHGRRKGNDFLLGSLKSQIWQASNPLQRRRGGAEMPRWFMIHHPWFVVYGL